jgi:hypothetical protein
VTPICTATNTVGRPIKTGANPFAVTMAITPNGKTLYVLFNGPPGPHGLARLAISTGLFGGKSSGRKHRHASGM